MKILLLNARKFLSNKNAENCSESYRQVTYKHILHLKYQNYYLCVKSL